MTKKQSKTIQEKKNPPRIQNTSRKTGSTNVYKPFLSNHLFCWKIKVVIPALGYFPRACAELVIAYVITLLKAIIIFVHDLFIEPGKNGKLLLFPSTLFS